MTPDLERVPLQLYEAAMPWILPNHASGQGCARESSSRLQAVLQMAENALASKADKKDIVSKAGQAIQFAEDARALAAQRQNEARIAADREAAAAKAKTEAEAKRMLPKEAKRQAELTAAKEAQMKAEAEAAAVKAKAEAGCGCSQGQGRSRCGCSQGQGGSRCLESKRRGKHGQKLNGTRKAAAELRAQLLDQFNRVLETRDTPRGLGRQHGLTCCLILVSIICALKPPKNWQN